jgi:AcrR family transcriptional regulator
MVDLLPADDRPMRSHARRNRERIIGAARDALTGTGCDTSLNEIARSAGVGIGTLFRHFPSRDALLEALTYDRTIALCTEAKRLQDTEEPAGALAIWLRDLIRHIATYRGLSASLLLAGSRGSDSDLRNSYQAIDAAVTALLQRAQSSGDVRHDLDTAALISMVGAISWLLEQNPEQARQVDYVMSVLTDGLRAAPAASGAGQLSGRVQPDSQDEDDPGHQ